MGLFGTIATFGVGYAAGAVTGHKGLERLPGRVREALPQAGQGDRVTDRREIRQIMTAAPDAVRPADTLQHAAQLMRTNDIGDVLVEDDDGRLLGIVTDRDLAIRATAEGADPAVSTVGDVYTRDLTTVTPTDSVADVVRRMRDGDVRRIPVVEAGRAIGIVSLGDIEVETRPGSPLADISAAGPDR
jgi:CBS domain-containing protein